VRLLQPEAQLAQISLRAAVPADLPPVRGDNTRLRQILFNLLTNAIQYTGPGGRVALSTRVLPHGALEIAIADNGPGIAAADLARVMLPFERAVDGTSSRHRGMGLGLALANHLVTLHGGVLTLDSAPGAGTTARVALPAGRVLSAA
jgi:signal transduction histidine kinase